MLANEILELVKNSPGISDGELAKILGKRHQHINNECHALENTGQIERRLNPETNLKGNYPVIAEQISVWQSIIKKLRKLFS